MTKSAQPVLEKLAFDALVRSHHAAVYASALRIVRDHDVALDVTQDVFLALLEGRIELRGGGDEQVLRWFAIRRGLQACRERSNRRRREERYAMEQPEARLDPAVLEREFALGLEQSVARLPDELRTALQLRYAEGLSFARVGEALEISEPAAFERVQRALGKLREALARAGLAAAAIDLERALEQPLSPPVVPPHVVPKLLALHAGAKAGSLTLALLLSAGFLTLLAIVVPRLQVGEDAHESEIGQALQTKSGSSAQVAAVEFAPVAPPSEPAATTRGSAAAQIEFASNQIEWTRVETQAEIVGRLQDAGFRPAADRVVIAESTERQGKFSRFAGRGATRADGSFTIPVPVGPDGTTSYVLVLEGRAEFAERARDELVRVQSGAVVDVGTLRLAPAATDMAGHYELDVRLIDADGAPVAGQFVIVQRAVRSPDGWSDQTFEVSAETDEQGRVHLVGERVGAKRILVDARARGWRKLVRELDLGPGRLSLELSLERGVSIAGRLVDVDGRPIVPEPDEVRFGRGVQLSASTAAQPNDWLFARIDEHGAFVIDGLDPKEYALRVQGGPWSQICVDGVRAPRQDLILRLKLDDDPLDRGDHCAEIHVRVVDQHTQAPVVVDVFGVEAVRLPEHTTLAEFESDLAAGLNHERPVQREFSGEALEMFGQARVTGLEAGTYALVVRVSGYAPEFLAPVELGAREIVSGRVLGLVPSATLSGRVLDPEGRPVAGAFVCVSGSGPSSEDRAQAIQRELERTDGHPGLATFDLVETSAEGAFEIRGLSPRYGYVVRAFHRSHAPTASARVSPEATSPVEVRFTARR